MSLSFCSSALLPQIKLLPLDEPLLDGKGHPQLPIVCHDFPSTHIPLDFGKFKGKILSSLPDSYLNWMTDKLRGSIWAILSEKELDERFITTPLAAPTVRAARQLPGKYWTSASQKQKAEQLKEALDRLERGDTCANADIYASLVRQCADAKVLSEGRRLHTHIMRSGYGGDRYLRNHLVHMYGNCGSQEDARAVFDRITDRNAFSWNAMISAYVHNGYLEDARSMFDKMPQRDVVSWNAMVAAYAQNGHGKEALELFRRMNLEAVNPSKITFIHVLDACGSLADLQQGVEIHASIVDGGYASDVVVGTALVKMYGNCGSPEGARSVFDTMPERNVVSWNTMLAAYAQNGRCNEAFKLFRYMDVEGVSPNKITFACLLDACANLTALAQGKAIHARVVDVGFESDVVVGTALVNMYGKCGSLDDARRVFDRMPQRDVISWTAMITSYSQNGNGKDALQLFQQMDLEGVKPDKITYVGVLDACASLAALTQGKAIHARIVDSGFESDVVVGNAVVNMYGKCGSLNDARSMFAKMPRHNVVSWTTMITAYAQDGHGKEALELFRLMDLEGMMPNKITFINILFACSHVGLEDDGWRYFVSMSRDHGIRPTTEHYGCMIDLIGRSGQLYEADDLIKNMPFEPDDVSWMTFLGSCRIHGNMELGVHAAKQAFMLDPKNAAPYVLLSNIYAAAGWQDDVAKVRKAMEDRGIKTYPGCSCIGVKDMLHEFVVVTNKLS